MFTTGSKLFIGAAGLSLAGAVLLSATVGGQGAVITLIASTILFGVLAGLELFTRGSTSSAMDPDAAELAPAGAPAPASSWWPILGVVGLALLVVGADTRPQFFVVGVLVLIVAGLEWVFKSWSDRATADDAHNATLRARVLGPLEYPLIGLVILAVIAFSMSRIFLFISKASGPFVFLIVAAVVSLTGFLVASKPNIKKGLMVGVGAIVGLGLISTGAVMAIDGQRKIEIHPTTSMDPAVCANPDKDPHIDRRAPQDVTMKSSLTARVVFENGRLTIENETFKERETLSLVRGAVNNVLFTNKDSTPRRFVVHLGSFPDPAADPPANNEPVMCTTLVEPNGKALLTMRFDQPTIASEKPYTIEVAGVADQSIEVVIP